MSKPPAIDDAPYVGHETNRPSDLTTTDFTDWLPTDRYHATGQVVRLTRAWLDLQASHHPQAKIAGTLKELFAELANDRTRRGNPQDTIEAARQRIARGRPDNALPDALSLLVAAEWVIPLTKVHDVLTREYGGLWVQVRDTGTQAARLERLHRALLAAGIKAPDGIAPLAERFAADHDRLPPLSRIAQAFARLASMDALPDQAKAIHTRLTAEYGRRYATGDEALQTAAWAKVLACAPDADAVMPMLDAHLMRPDADWPPRPADLLAMVRTGRPYIPTDLELLQWTGSPPAHLSNTERAGIAEALSSLNNPRHIHESDRQWARALAAAYWTAIGAPKQQPSAKPSERGKVEYLPSRQASSTLEKLIQTMNEQRNRH